MTLKTEDSRVVMQCVLLKSGKISKWASDYLQQIFLITERLHWLREDGGSGNDDVISI